MLLLPLGALLWATTAMGCPFCHTETGIAVRAGIFDVQFPSRLVAVLSPFPLLLLVVVALHTGWTPNALGTRIRAGVKKCGARLR